MSKGAKFGLASVVAVLLALGGAGIVVLMAASAANGHAGSRSTESCLRSIATGTPGGAYWLGPNFHDAVISSSCAWSQTGRYSEVDYQSDTIFIHVWSTLDGESPYPTAGLELQGDAAVIQFAKPDHPSAALIQEARAALQPIPADVIFSG